MKNQKLGRLRNLPKVLAELGLEPGSLSPKATHALSLCAAGQSVNPAPLSCRTTIEASKEAKGGGGVCSDQGTAEASGKRCQLSRALKGGPGLAFIEEGQVQIEAAAEEGQEGKAAGLCFQC